MVRGDYLYRGVVKWYSLGPQAATRDLWVVPNGPSKPELGGWHDASGREVREALGQVGPPGVSGVQWWFAPPRGHYGKRLVDALWQGGFGLKVYSERLCAVMEASGARLQTWQADVRLLDGSPVPGYRAVHEELHRPGPVHSFLMNRRTGRVTIDEDVRNAIVEAGLAGLEIDEVAGPFPGGDFNNPPAEYA